MRSYVSVRVRIMVRWRYCRNPRGRIRVTWHFCNSNALATLVALVEVCAACTECHSSSVCQQEFLPNLVGPRLTRLLWRLYSETFEVGGGGFKSSGNPGLSICYCTRCNVGLTTLLRPRRCRRDILRSTTFCRSTRGFCCVPLISAVTGRWEPFRWLSPRPTHETWPRWSSTRFSARWRCT